MNRKALLKKLLPEASRLSEEHSDPFYSAPFPNNVLDVKDEAMAVLGDIGSLPQRYLASTLTKQKMEDQSSHPLKNIIEERVGTNIPYAKEALDFAAQAVIPDPSDLAKLAIFAGPFGIKNLGKSADPSKMFKSHLHKYNPEVIPEQQYHIVDDMAKIKSNEGAVLGDILDHPELYKAYPEAKEIPVIFKDDPDLSPMGNKSNASFSWDTEDANNIKKRLIQLSPDWDLSHLLHELQHNTQVSELGDAVKNLDYTPVVDWDKNFAVDNNKLRKLVGGPNEQAQLRYLLDPREMEAYTVGEMYEKKGTALPTNKINSLKGALGSSASQKAINNIGNILKY